MYNMTIVNSYMVYLKVVKRVDPKSSHHKGKKFLFWYLYEMLDVKLNLLWQSCHSICNSGHYVAHLKLTQCFMSAIYQ